MDLLSTTKNFWRSNNKCKKYNNYLLASWELNHLVLQNKYCPFCNKYPVLYCTRTSWSSSDNSNSHIGPTFAISGLNHFIYKMCDRIIQYLSEILSDKF